MNYIARKRYFTTLFSILFAAILWESFPRKAVADESALYDKAPEGSAFIRLISLTDTPVIMTLADKPLRSTEYCRASHFQYLPAGSYQQDVNGRQWHAELKPDAIYSLVVSATESWLIEEPKVKSSRKGMLAVYNFTPYNSVTIRTRKGGMAVFNKLPQGGSLFRSVNPMKIDLSAFSDGQHLLDTPAVIFQSGVLSSLFLCGRGETIESHWAMN